MVCSRYNITLQVRIVCMGKLYHHLAIMTTDPKPSRKKKPNPLTQAGSKRVNLAGLEAATGIPARTLRTLFHQKKIPGLRLGHRTVIFDPTKVQAALDRFEQKAIA